MPVQESGDEHDLLNLQRLVGNAAVSVLVQRQAEPAPAAAPGGAGPADAAAPGGAGPGAAAAPAEPTQFMMAKQLMVVGTVTNGQVTDVQVTVS
jgi:hypothetical protein